MSGWSWSNVAQITVAILLAGLVLGVVAKRA